MTKLQIVSDIHLEYFKKCQPFPQLVKCADNLALLGDIGKPFDDNYEEFIKIQASNYNTVIVIMGNHEYYGKRIVDVVLEKARKICASFKNVHLLERDVLDLTDNTRLLGCTLWSALGKYASFQLNDMNSIRVRSDNPPFEKLLSHETYFSWHVRDVQWITSEIQKASNENKKVIILTHHGPLLEMGGKYYGNKNSSAFVSDLRHLFKDPVVAFASGHVHSNVDILYNGIRSVSNAYGYIKEETDFKDNVVIHVP